MQKKQETVKTLLPDLLALQVDLKLHHWTTESFARHRASDALHGAMSDLTDRLVEASIGRMGRGKVLPGHGVSDADSVHRLVKMRERLQQFNASDAPDLLAIRDEMVEKINATLYLYTQA